MNKTCVYYCEGEIKPDINVVLVFDTDVMTNLDIVWFAAQM